MKISSKPTFFSGRLTISVPFEFQNSFVFVGFPKHTPHLFHVHASVTPMQMRSSYVNKVGRERERERERACACGVRVCFLQSWLKNLKDPSPLLSFYSSKKRLNWTLFLLLICMLRLLLLPLLEYQMVSREGDNHEVVAGSVSCNRATAAVSNFG